MKLLLDSNIVIDFLAKREPFYESAEKLMLLGMTGDLELWVSTTQANDIFYVLGKGRKSEAELVKQKMRKLKTFMRFCGLNEEHFLNVLDSSWLDLEDACVHEVAVYLSADAIITRNKKDFAKSIIPVYDCDEFFQHMKTKGAEY
jgi:predicted nucleic acid-binding protein